MITSPCFLVILWGDVYCRRQTRIAWPEEWYVLWVELPEELESAALCERAIAEGIAYVPEGQFSPIGTCSSCLRLDCGNAHTPQIENTVRWLGTIFSRS